jgi:glucosamine--fructose-6-phosphate aminotransferase (isomerizing)
MPVVVPRRATAISRNREQPKEVERAAAKSLFNRRRKTAAEIPAFRVLTLPKASHYLTPIVMTIPLQLLAYYIAVLGGKDVDQPRNLAKSVTVE